MLRPGVKIHFVGIGGVGMSGLARVLLEKGMVISGSDLNLNGYTASLSSMGAKIFKGHCASNIKDADLVVYSSSIPPHNIELVTARRLKKPVLSRLTLFQEFVKPYRSIMVTGTHGKTTTTALISHILLNLGLAPTVLLGGNMSPFGNARLGKSEYLVAELDESDGEFVKVTPSFAIITNIENDHLDHFGSLSGLSSVFEKFIKNPALSGLMFFSGDKILRKFKSTIKEKKIYTYGLDSGCDYQAQELSIGPKSRFKFFERGKFLDEISLSIPGRHNVINATAAIGAALSLGLEFNKVREAIPDFLGVSRRFELKGEVNGIKVIEDYAHHPTEINATLSTARLYKPGRILAIFQPHRYTRTNLLMKDFASSFSKADTIAITEIYSASEKNISCVSSRDIVKLIKERTDTSAYFFKTPEEAGDFIVRGAKKGDMILILGAGDVNRISKQILEGLQCERVSV